MPTQDGVSTDPAVQEWPQPTNAHEPTTDGSFADSPTLLRPEGKLVLDTDASNHAVGAVLSQEQDGVGRVLAYYSRSERQYCVTRKELLAVVKAVPRLPVRAPIHAALKWLLNFRNPEGQVAR